MSFLNQPWCRLLRIGNLLYLSIMLFLLRFCILEPLYQRLDSTSTLSLAAYTLLVFSIVAIAAAGYILNDLEDIATDTINKPQRVSITQNISPPLARQVAILLNIAAIGAGFAAAYLAGNYKLAWIQVVCMLLLWQYARQWKKTALWGNIVVALLAALAVLMPVLYEQELFFTLKDQTMAALLKLVGYDSQMVQSPESFRTGLAPNMLSYIIPYSVFAFLLSLVREIVKDIEDLKGDQMANYKTLPIVAGLGWSKLAALIPLLLSIYLVVQFVLRQVLYRDFIAAGGAISFIVLPLIWYVFRLRKATEKSDFSLLSKTAKIIMVMGLAYLPYLAVKLKTMPIVPPETKETTNQQLPNEETITDIQIDTIIRTGDIDPGDTLNEQPQMIIGDPK